MNSSIFTKEEKNKLATIEESANNYTHPTHDGYKHVPATEYDNNGKFLKAGAHPGSSYWSKLLIDDVDELRNFINILNLLTIETTFSDSLSPHDWKVYWIDKYGGSIDGVGCQVFSISENGSYKISGCGSIDIPLGVFKNNFNDVVGYIEVKEYKEPTFVTKEVIAPKDAVTLWVNESDDENEVEVCSIIRKFIVNYDDLSDEIKAMIDNPGDIDISSAIQASQINGNIIVDNEEIVVYEHPDGNHVTDKEKSVLENIDTYIKTVVSDLMEDYEIVENDLSSLYPIYYASITTSPTSASDITKSFTQTNIRKFTIPAGQYCIACEQEFSRIRDTNFFDNTETFEKTKVDDLYVYTYKNTTLIPMEFTVYF